MEGDGPGEIRVRPFFMSRQDRTLRRFSGAVFHAGAGPLTNTLVLAIALGAATACAVGEQPRTGPAAPPPASAPAQPPTVPAVAVDSPVVRRPSAEPVRIGLLLPETGPTYLQQYADLLLEGIRMAVRESDADVELVVLDDAGLAWQDSALIGAAIDSGVIAVIGPLLSSGVASATAAREEALLLISPTAAEIPGAAADAYTLNGVDLRGPRALAEYAMSGDLRSAAVIYPSDEALARQAWAFARAFQELGGRVATMVPYDSGTTTFGTHIGRVVDARPDVVYLPLSPQDVQVVAPQLAYYGLRGRGANVPLLGNEAWLDDEVLRLVDGQFTEGVVAATASPRVFGETGWDDFVRAYEETYRRSLDNPFPALGYDAMRLLLSAVDDGANTRARIAERFAATRAFRGATGVLSVEDGVITRAPFIYRIVGARPTAAPPADQLRLPTPVDAGQVPIEQLQESPR